MSKEDRSSDHNGDRKALTRSGSMTLAIQAVENAAGRVPPANDSTAGRKDMELRYFLISSPRRYIHRGSFFRGLFCTFFRADRLIFG